MKNATQLTTADTSSELIRTGRGPRSVVWLVLLGLLAANSIGRSADTPVARKTSPAITKVSFAVLSDIHLHSERLGNSGTAFEAYLEQDPKLLRESESIFGAAIQQILQEHVDFAILSGDLTKDGEMANHDRVAKYLKILEKHGIKALVVPGNHDINNSSAVRYRGDRTRPVSTVTPKQFSRIYWNYGYGHSVLRDKNSLSYVAEPVPGLWLLGIDSCKYDESKELGYPVVSGRIRPETMIWIQNVMSTAQVKGKQVIAFMHHGVNQHFFGEADLFPDYLVDDWMNTSIALAQTGLKVVFTGHYHSLDAAYLVDANMNPVSPLCDVETSSLVSYPCAYRVATLDGNGILHVETRPVTTIEADLGGLSLQQYAFNTLFPPTSVLAAVQLENAFGLPADQASAIAPLVTQGLMANYGGDETPSEETQATIANLLSSPEPMHTLGTVLWGLWTDLPPADSELELSLGSN